MHPKSCTQLKTGDAVTKTQVNSEEKISFFSVVTIITVFEGGKRYFNSNSEIKPILHLYVGETFAKTVHLCRSMRPGKLPGFLSVTCCANADYAS